MRGLWYPVRAQLALTRMELSALSAYRAQILLGAFSWVVPLVMMVLWLNADAGSVDPGRLTAYFLTTLVLTSLNPLGYLVFGFGRLVHDGRLSALLLRPVHPATAILAQGLARAVVGLPAVVAMVAAVVAFVDASFSADPRTLGWATVLFVLGLIGVGQLSTMVGTIAFWSTKAEGMQSVIFVGEWVLGGLVAPFAVISGWFARIGYFQPFFLALGGPAELVSGLRSPETAPGLALVGVAWVVALHLLGRVVWRAGMARFEAVGT